MQVYGRPAVFRQGATWNLGGTIFLAGILPNRASTSALASLSSDSKPREQTLQHLTFTLQKTQLLFSSTEGLNLRVEGWRLEGQATNAHLAAGLLGGMPVWPEAAQQAAKAREGPSEVHGWVVPHPEPLGREVQAPEPTWAKQTATKATCSGPPSSRPECAGCRA